MNKLPITVIVPILNEAANLSTCLSELKRFAKVVVVDSGSTDNSCQIAEQFKAEVIQFKWDGKFPKKRNWTLRNYKFTTEWVLFLDADEKLNGNFINECEHILPHTPHNGFWLRYQNIFIGKLLTHGDIFEKLALLRIGSGEYERINEDAWSKLDMEIHEHPQLEGTIGCIQTPIEHNEHRSLQHYKAKHDEYSSWEAQRYLTLMNKSNVAFNKLSKRQQRKYKYITRWWFAPSYFIVCYIFKKGFLDGTAGYHFALGKALYFHQIRSKIQKAKIV